MQNRFVWVAFLLTCFGVTGLTGLFASYAGSIPLERALYRSRVLDSALVSDGTPDTLQRLLGPEAPLVAKATGDLPSRIAAAKAAALDEGEREARAVGDRTRLMLGVVTVLAGGLGAGILLIAARPAPTAEKRNEAA